MWSNDDRAMKENTWQVLWTVAMIWSTYRLRKVAFRHPESERQTKTSLDVGQIRLARDSLVAISMHRSTTIRAPFDPDSIVIALFSAVVDVVDSVCRLASTSFSLVDPNEQDIWWERCNSLSARCSWYCRENCLKNDTFNCETRRKERKSNRANMDRNKKVRTWHERWTKHETMRNKTSSYEYERHGTKNNEKRQKKWYNRWLWRCYNEWAWKCMTNDPKIV